MKWQGRILILIVTTTYIKLKKFKKKLRKVFYYYYYLPVIPTICKESKTTSENVSSLLCEVFYIPKCKIKLANIFFIVSLFKSFLTKRNQNVILYKFVFQSYGNRLTLVESIAQNKV